MSKKVFVYLPEKEMADYGFDPEPYKEKLHQIAESLCGELLTDVSMAKEEIRTHIGRYMEFLKACDEADVIITIESYNPFSEGPKMQLWRITGDILMDIRDHLDKRVFSIDSANLFTQMEIGDIWNKRYGSQSHATVTCSAIPCREGKIEEV